MVKMVQWDVSLIINRAPHTGLGFLPTGLYILLPVMRINLQVLAGRWDDSFSSGIGFGIGFGDTGMERNLRRFLVSGINGKNGAMGFFSDHAQIPGFWNQW